MTSSFKYKPNKVKYLQSVNTLDRDHKLYIATYEKDLNSVGTKRKELDKLHKELDRMNKLSRNDITNIDLKKKITLKEKIKKINEYIDNLENDTDILNYFSNQHDILFEYYDNENNELNKQKFYDEQNREQKKEISDNDEKLSADKEELSLDTHNKDNLHSESLKELSRQSQLKRKLKKPTKKRSKVTDVKTSQNIFNFFNTSTDTNKDTSEIQNNSVNNIEKSVTNKASLYDEYLILNGKNKYSRKKHNYLWCSDCNAEKVLVQSDGICVCKICGKFDEIIMESDVPNYKEIGTEKPAYPYKRLNHLIECLNQFQAKESIKIPSEIFELILNEIKKNKININKLDFRKMKTILKKLRLQRYYEHMSYIMSQITGKPAPTLSREMEDQIKIMFKKIQEPFAHHCPPTRTNFLSYSFVLHKIFQLLKLKEFLCYFPLLKSREKLREQDRIWKPICKDVGWTFYSSV